MTALGKDRKTDQLDTPDTVLPRLAYILAAAATTLYAGSIGCVNASGYAVPGSASNTLRVVGRVEATVKNTTAEGLLPWCSSRSLRLDQPHAACSTLSRGRRIRWR